MSYSTLLMIRDCISFLLILLVSTMNTFLPYNGQYGLQQIYGGNMILSTLMLFYILIALNILQYSSFICASAIITYPLFYNKSLQTSVVQDLIIFVLAKWLICDTYSSIINKSGLHIDKSSLHNDSIYTTNLEFFCNLSQFFVVLYMTNSGNLLTKEFANVTRDVTHTTDTSDFIESMIFLIKLVFPVASYDANIISVLFAIMFSSSFYGILISLSP